MYFCAHVCLWNHLFDHRQAGFGLLSQTGVELLLQIKDMTLSALQTLDSAREWVWMPYQVDPTSAYRCRLPKPPGATERFERALSDVGLKVVWAIDDGADWWLLILALPCIKRPSPKRDWESVWYRGFTLKSSHSCTCCFWIDVNWLYFICIVYKSWWRWRYIFKTINGLSKKAQYFIISFVI